MSFFILHKILDPGNIFSVPVVLRGEGERGHRRKTKKKGRR